jgi:hypothetical protein
MNFLFSTIMKWDNYNGFFDSNLIAGLRVETVIASIQQIFFVARNEERG